MWSGLSNIFKKLLGGGKAIEQSFSLPEVDRLVEDFSQTEELEGPGGPISAREGFELAVEIVKGFDSQARLTNVESVGRLSPDGRCEGWQWQDDRLVPVGVSVDLRSRDAATKSAASSSCSMAIACSDCGRPTV